MTLQTENWSKKILAMLRSPLEPPLTKWEIFEIVSVFSIEKQKKNVFFRRSLQ